MRSVARVLAIAGVVLAVLAVRVVTGARAELRRGDRLAAAQNVDGAILAYRRAARWYAPGNPYDEEALDKLAAIGAETEDPARSLAAWRAVRGAILSTRSFYVPHRDRLDRADEAIARRVTEAAARSDRGAARASVRASLAPPARPHLGWTLLLLVGWMAWTGGAFAFALRALDEEDRLVAKPARLIGTIVVVGFGMFVIGLALA